MGERNKHIMSSFMTSIINDPMKVVAATVESLEELKRERDDERRRLIAHVSDESLGFIDRFSAMLALCDAPVRANVVSSLDDGTVILWERMILCSPDSENVVQQLVEFWNRKSEDQWSYRVAVKQIGVRQ